MDIKGKTILVTGANRGLGRQFTQALLAAGAAKVYAGARDPQTVTQPGVQAVRLDVTDAESIAAAAAALTDVDVVVNNAGIMQPASLLAPADIGAIRKTFDVNVWGLLAVTQAFAPVLKRNGGGAVVNVLSVLSWVALPTSGAYSASKAAAWALTNGLRHELRSQGTRVVGVHPAYIDTDMTAGVAAPKSTPEHVVAEVLRALADGHDEVLVDDVGRNVKQSLSSATPAYLAA
ncbi:SDR family oxidoreductase [Ralstonia mannitolilytica]|uniref:3-phenylpropionate-dihydrodiol/cinnamic acid-dihydrodiol dehydrogenase n=1 Tax=Ralstonia mannitolilytica TaxID=105219 RepID=A0AAD2EGP8_9RALS|nr:SDR family oxidoreductase [Ralstonia mannitolilytica]MBY4717000.1 SDR family oxidoreductase [Ralstonia mannitolilytica]CAJ0680524.1 3-phenylpropionate-dihydrodiol/cinnamic acid-dihydrodiol dehydrogenase [Ralstonia mannitolilytica]CAJ0685443.1 3-phenylpropionate-dihydrodiol/cinnamic acid-dihydrodiol dehydrogenase [Ralstonia mannitolilytica]CAJ0716645.1 3-phenylpropionate-dihydrodiol/cinnamic acid-dihydrodiol dehydrogenase [Ralstonia mannitolilytica]CAJ0863615.1 3-phenylpropionate-dihydrodiol